MKGYGVVSKYSQKFQTHFLLASHVADILKAEDLPGVKRLNKNFSSCHICYVRREQFFGCTQSLKRNTTVTVQLVQSLCCSEMRSAVKEMLRKNWMLPALPVWSSFPFVRIQKLIKLYSMFRVEPMHVLSLGARKMLKECLKSMLGDDNGTTDVFKTAKRRNKSFKQITRNLLHLLNEFLTETERVSVGSRLTIDFQKVTDWKVILVFSLTLLLSGYWKHLNTIWPTKSLFYLEL